MLILSIVVTVSRKWKHQIVHFEYVQFIVYTSHINNSIFKEMESKETDKYMEKYKQYKMMTV